MLHSQAPHQRQKNFDYIKVCSLTWGWASSTSAGFVPSNASTSPHAAQHTSVEASCICTMLVAVSAGSHHCGCFEPKCLLYICMLKSLMSPNMYFDMANPLQRTEAQSTLGTIQHNPVDLWSWLPSLVWWLGMGCEGIFLLVVTDSSNLGLHKPFPALSPCTLK